MLDAAITLVLDEQQKPIINLLKPLDGNPAIHGKQLARFLSKVAILPNNCTEQPQNNEAVDMSCLAAQIIANFKMRPGQFYIGHVDSNKAEYIYQVYKGPKTKIKGHPRHKPYLKILQIIKDGEPIIIYDDDCHNDKFVRFMNGKD